MNANKLAEQVKDYVVDFRRDIHMHPEPSMAEFRTTDRIAEELDKLGVSYRRLEPTGIIAEVKGAGAGKTVALRADIDALSITEQTDLEFKSANEGYMHACGHDTHGAMLLGAVKALDSIKESFSGTVRFIFQPGEEVCEGATAVIKQGGLEGVDKIFGIHIGTMRPVGEIGSSKGAAYAATDRFKLAVNGKACHGAAPHTGVDATVCAAAVITNIQTLVSREFDPMQPIVVTVGSITSGSRFNIISGQAVMEGTVRSFDRDVHAALPEAFERMVEKICEAHRCTADLNYEIIAEVLVNDEECRQLGIAAAKKITDPSFVVEDIPTMGGEDFSEYLVHTPGAFFNLGVGGDYPIHSDRMQIDEAALQVGVAMHIQVALDALSL